MTKSPFNYDYSRTLWMKMFLAIPDYKTNCSDVKITFEEAMEIIKAADAITQGITKIIYLVGWQGLGHDDCFPEMHVVNDALKRECDKNGHESLLWLIEEAKKYHTVVSIHGNLSDEYAENASHGEFVEADAICKTIDGEPAVIEIFNGRNAYKVSYKQYWESGLFKKYWDKFCETVPVREAGTIHLDNFCVAESLCPRTDFEEQNRARNEILDFIRSEGIDITSEYTYRELPLRADTPEHPVRKLYAQLGEELPEKSWQDAPMHTLGRIAATWWTSGMTAEECISVPPSLYSGHLTDPALYNVFYGTMHGEDVWMEHGPAVPDWAAAFTKNFCTEQLPYMYLNRYERLRIESDSDDEQDSGRYTAFFSDGVVSCGRDRSIAKNGVQLKCGGDVILPLTDDNRLFLAYSENGRSGRWNVPDADFAEADVYAVSAEGNTFIGTVKTEDGTVTLTCEGGQALAVIAR